MTTRKATKKSAAVAKKTAKKSAIDKSATAPSTNLQRIDIKLLRFDPLNPRLVPILPGKTTQGQIQDILLNNMEARELVPSFIENGYLPYEPLIVRPEEGGTFVVLEGNRRLAALLSMRDSSDEQELKAYQEHDLAHPPCLVFTGGKEEELAYLGLRHLSKTKDWSALAKAAFVERMLSSGIALADAGRITNTQRNALRQMLLVRRLFERAGQLGIDVPSTRAEGEVTFWHLGDAIRRTNTQKYLELEENENPLEQPSLDESRFEHLLTWLYGSSKTRQQRIITSIRDIPNLDKCLAHPKSVEALEAGANIADAMSRMEAAGVKVTATLDRAKDFVQKATGGLSDIDVEAIPDIASARRSVEGALKAFDATFEFRSDELKGTTSQVRVK
jgi:hypothetical protein